MRGKNTKNSQAWAGSETSAIHASNELGNNYKIRAGSETSTLHPSNELGNNYKIL